MVRLALALATSLILADVSAAANYRTENFVVQAASPQVARLVAEAAEKYRRDLAIEWLGKELPNWARPCPVKVEVGPNLGAGGATSFVFDRGEVFGWNMDIQGPMDRLLDSVLPHEVTHTIFATHFRQPLPRWADEGACTTVEHESERNKQQRMLVQFLQTGRGISFSHMFRMKEYPRDVLPLYAQGHSLATYLIHHGGKARYLQFLEDGLKSENWIGALQQHYGFENMSNLQNTWLDWVAAGSPLSGNGDIATAAAMPQSPSNDITYRGQDPGVRLAGAQTAAPNGIVPGYARPESGSADPRSTNRNQQAPPQANDWRPTRGGDSPGALRPVNRNNAPAAAGENSAKVGTPQTSNQTSKSASVAGSSNANSNNGGQTKLLLEWSRGVSSQKSSQPTSSGAPTRTILR